MWTNTIAKVLLFPITIVVLLFVKLYKWTISPLLPHTCRYYPSCSGYMYMAIKEWGVMVGLYLGIKRLFRCRPKQPVGEDFVPQNIKGELRWTY